MIRLAKTSLFLATLLTAGTAFAGVEERDHRRQPPPAPPAPTRPEARDHRDNGGPPATTRRYRRRPGPRIMAPLRIDLGMQGLSTDRGYLPGIELKVGIHWASLSPEPTPIDIGLGLQVAAFGGPEMADPNAETDVVYGGAYLEGAYSLSHGRFWRTWAGGRAEYNWANVFGAEEEGIGLAGRLAAELFASGVGIEPRGVFLGSYAIGVYMEVGIRDLGGADGAEVSNPIQVSGGLTFRTPLVFGP